MLDEKEKGRRLEDGSPKNIDNQSPINIANTTTKVSDNPRGAPNFDMARKFLSMLDPRAPSFTFQVCDDRKPARPAEIIIGSFDSVKGRLAAYNRQGYGVFVTVNETDGRGRKRENIVRPRAVWQELDLPKDGSVPIDEAESYRAQFDSVFIAPSIEVESSPGNRHNYYLCDNLSNDDFEGCQRQMVESHGGDPNARDLCRILRVPGFFHCKGEPVMSRLVSGDGKWHSHELIMAAFPPIHRDESNAPAIKGDMPHSDAAEALIRSWTEAIRGQRAAERQDWLTWGFAFARLGDDWAEVPGRGDIRLELWESLSKKCEGYEENTGCTEKWDEILRYASREHSNPATFRSLQLAAKAAGWTWENSGIDPALIETAKATLGAARGALERPSPEECFESVALDDDWRAGPGAKDGNGDKPARRRTAWEFMRERKPTVPVIDGLISAGGLYTLTGATGAGKTGLMLNMALAVAFNRAGLIGRDVEPGCVLYMTAENPNKFRDRLILACLEYGISDDELKSGRLQVMGGFATTAEMLAEARAMLADGVVRLVLVDTLQSYFAGNDSNANAEVLKFVRSFRKITELAGEPAVLIAAHPTKGMTTEKLVPYGGGAILNEVDGNFTFTAAPDGKASKLHWEGKLRESNFEPALFLIEERSNPGLADGKGRLLKLPLLRPGTLQDAAESERRTKDAKIKILRSLLHASQPSHAAIGTAAGLPETTVRRHMKTMAAGGLVKKPIDYELTPAGVKMARASAASMATPEGVFKQ